MLLTFVKANKLQLMDGSLLLLNGHEYIDLGLSVKWATCNVGADKPYDIGDHYAWGEIEQKSRYLWINYKWCNKVYNDYFKYNSDINTGIVDNLTELELIDDAAHSKWGGNWRMPTKEEFWELENNCTWLWTQLDNDMCGYKITSNIEGFTDHFIILPAAGYYRYAGLNKVCEYGGYWSRTHYTRLSHKSCLLSFNAKNHHTGREYRYYGLSIRPVCP